MCQVYFSLHPPRGEKARFGPKAAAGPVSSSDVEGTCQTLAVKMRTLKRRWRRARADSSCASLPSLAAVGSLWHISVRRSLVSLSRIGASGRQPPRLSAILLQFNDPFRGPYKPPSGTTVLARANLNLAGRNLFASCATVFLTHWQPGSHPQAGAPGPVKCKGNAPG